MLLSLWGPCLGLHGASYYVNSGGSDVNPGSILLPWKTVAAVNATTFFPGDQVYFAAGQTFTGSVYLDSTDSGGPGNPLILGSYGAGRATLAPPASQDGVDVVDGEWIELQDLIVRGTGGSSTGHGLQIYNSSAASRHHFSMSNCDVTRFGGDGLHVVAGTATGGYHEVSVTASDFHNNKGCGVGFDGSFWDQSPRPNANFYFGHCRFYNNISSGLILVEMSGALVEYCEAHDNGPSSGCIGFWCWSADHVVFQFSESHHNTRTAGGSDGGGFDLDGATRDSVMQYNYSHDNDGGGFALYQFGWAELSGPTINNIIRFNVSQNDGKKGNYGGISMYGDGFFSGQPWPGDFVEYTEIYNNTIYTSTPAQAAVVFIFDSQRDILFYNNIFYNSNMSTFVDRNPGADDGSILFKNNDYWRPGGAFRIDFGGTVYSSFATWQGSGLGNQEKEGATLRGAHVDPLLTAPGTAGILWPAPLYNLTAYQLQASSPMIDQGVDLSTRLALAPVPGPIDYWQVPIPVGPAYDIGAHEYIPPSPTPTFTCTPTITLTHSITPTYSGSPTATETPTLTPTRTITPTRSASPTVTESPTATATGTISPTYSVSPTWTASPTITETQTPAPVANLSGPFEVLAHAPVPNPQAGPRLNFAIKLSHPAAYATLRLYAPSLVEVQKVQGVTMAGWTQWQNASFDVGDLANGLYFYRIDLHDALGKRVVSSPGKLFVLR